MANSTNINDLLNIELNGNGGTGGILGGAVYVTVSNLNVPIGYYNYLYIPFGDGFASTYFDFPNYGTLYLNSFADDKMYIVNRRGGENRNAIQVVTTTT